MQMFSIQVGITAGLDKIPKRTNLVDNERSIGRTCQFDTRTRTGTEKTF